MTKEKFLIHPYAERVLRQIILKDLSDEDRALTEAAVAHVKESAKTNSKVLITVAYASRWDTPQRGAQLIERLLYQRLSSYYSEKEILEITDLVSKNADVTQLLADH